MESPALNFFMMSEAPAPQAFGALPPGFHFRTCRRDELETWKQLNLPDPTVQPIISDYFNRVYAARQQTFFERCVFACDEGDVPVGTCFVWQAYGQINTLHWFKVRPEYEGLGIGRALLTEVLRPLKPEDYPVFLHTHPSCFRAIKLYADFGFHPLRAPEKIGFRQNDYQESLPYLRECMPGAFFEALPEALDAPDCLLKAAASSPMEEF